MANQRTARISWVLLVVLVVALATGAAASILVSASTAPPPPPGPASLVFLPQWALTAIAFGVIAFIFGSLILWRLMSGPGAGMNRGTVTVLVVILLGILFVVGARFLGVGGSMGNLGGSGAGPAGGNTSGSNNSTVLLGGGGAGPGGHIVLFPNLPGWVPFAVLGAVALLVAVVALPSARRYLAERREAGGTRRRSSAEVPSGMREALTRASADLDLGGDPRVVILALYGRMLQYLQPMVGGVETRTPEEIRATYLERLGVRPTAARTLTRLFEEARYSDHPMGPAESVRAQAAVRATLDDLARRAPRE